MMSHANDARMPRAAFDAGDYVVFNCGASVPGLAATKCTSHPRAGGHDSRLYYSQFIDCITTGSFTAG